MQYAECAFMLSEIGSNLPHGMLICMTRRGLTGPFEGCDVAVQKWIWIGCQPGIELEEHDQQAGEGGQDSAEFQESRKALQVVFRATPRVSQEGDPKTREYEHRDMCQACRRPEDLTC